MVLFFIEQESCQSYKSCKMTALCEQHENNTCHRHTMGLPDCLIDEPQKKMYAARTAVHLATQQESLTAQ